MVERPFAPAKSVRRVATASRPSGKRLSKAVAVPTIKNSLSIAELKSGVEAWLLDGEILLSPNTMVSRRVLCEKLF